MDISKLKEKLQYFELNLSQLHKQDQAIKTLTSDDKLTCQDKNGFLYSLSYNNMCTTFKRKGIFATFFNRNPFTYENIINYLKINNIPVELVSNKNELDKAISLIKWRCITHNETFMRSWNQIQQGTIKCDKCLQIIYKNSPLKPDYSKIQNHFLQCNCTLLSTSDEYENNYSPLGYICNNHKDKNIQITNWQTFQSSLSCPYCSRQRVFNSRRKTNEQFIRELKQIHGNDYTTLSKYKSSKDKIKLICNKCNCEFTMKPHHLLAGRGCPKCNMSRGEKKIDMWLQKNHIPYASQYTFDNCRDKSRKMPFDFAIFENANNTKLKYLIEYQGEQHYKPVRFNGISINQAYTNLDTVQKNDKLKKEYCVNHKIALLEIPYWEFNNMEKILLQQ